MPAKRGQFAGDAEGARQYLANLIAADQWSAVKPLDQYKDGQIIRKANAFRQQEIAGVAFDNKAARGHADIIPTREPTPLHPTGRSGGRTQPTSPPSQPSVQRPTGTIIGGHGPVAGGPVPVPAPSKRPRKDEKIFHAPSIPLNTQINGPRGSYQMNTTRFADVIRELKAIEKAKGADAKVYFSLWDNRKGDWTKLYVQKGRKSPDNGVRVGDLLARMKSAVKSKTSRTERSALIDSWQGDMDAGEAGGSGYEEADELPVVFSVVGVHVMGA